MKTDGLSVHYADKGVYDRLDRIVFNGYLHILQIPGVFRNWHLDFKGDEKYLDNNSLMKLLRKMAKRLYVFAKSRNIPAISFKSGERKHLFVNDDLPEGQPLWSFS